MTTLLEMQQRYDELRKKSPSEMSADRREHFKQCYDLAAQIINELKKEKNPDKENIKLRLKYLKFAKADCFDVFDCLSMQQNHSEEERINQSIIKNIQDIKERYPEIYLDFLLEENAIKVLVSLSNTTWRSRKRKSSDMNTVDQDHISAPRGYR